MIVAQCYLKPHGTPQLCNMLSCLATHLRPSAETAMSGYKVPARCT